MIMKVTVFGDKLKNPEKIENVRRMVGCFEGTCFVSERKTKPNGVWRRRDKIDGNGVWFYKLTLGNAQSEIWERIKESDRVVLVRGDETGQRERVKPSKIPVPLKKNAQPSLRDKYFINKDGEEETLSDGIVAKKDGTYEFYLSEKYHPVAFGNKVLELIENGYTVGDAKAVAAATPVCMEVYYETGKGLFMVECSAVERDGKIHSPYTRKAYRSNGKV